MSCKHGNWEPCEDCEEEDRRDQLAYERGFAAGVTAATPSPQTDAALREEVQPAAPDMAEVERLLLHFEKRAPWVRHEQRAALLDYVRQFAAAPQPVFALTEDQIQRHKIRADDCLPDSEVLLVRSVRRFADKAAPQPVSEEALDILRSENERLRACLRDVQREAAGYARGMVEADKICRLYNELLYQVETKNPSETRHETALVYIRMAEKYLRNQNAQEVKP